jgi:hypothetical protein
MHVKYCKFLWLTGKLVGTQERFLSLKLVALMLRTVLKCTMNEQIVHVTCKLHVKYEWSNTTWKEMYYILIKNKPNTEFNRNPFSGFIFGVNHEDEGPMSSYPHDHSVTLLPFHVIESKQLIKRCWIVYYPRQCDVWDTLRGQSPHWFIQLVVLRAVIYFCPSSFICVLLYTLCY